MTRHLLARSTVDASQASICGGLQSFQPTAFPAARGAPFLGPLEIASYTTQEMTISLVDSKCLPTASQVSRRNCHFWVLQGCLTGGMLCTQDDDEDDDEDAADEKEIKQALKGGEVCCQ